MMLTHVTLRPRFRCQRTLTAAQQEAAICQRDEAEEVAAHRRRQDEEAAGRAAEAVGKRGAVEAATARSMAQAYTATRSAMRQRQNQRRGDSAQLEQCWRLRQHISRWHAEALTVLQPPGWPTR